MQNEALYQVAPIWSFETDGDPTELVKDMMHAMYSGNGIGLAAPQLGISARIFVMGTPSNTIACINPEILEHSVETVVEREGCLSFPGVQVYVPRPKTVKVRYQTVVGTVVETELSGIQARCFQHELDHLNGICFHDRVSRLAWDRAVEKAKKVKRKVQRIAKSL